MKHPLRAFLQLHGTWATHQLVVSKKAFERCLWKVLSWISSCTRKFFSKQDLNRHFWNPSNICATSNSSESRCTSTKILPAAEDYSLASLPWQFTVAWGNAAKLALLALQQVIHRQLSHPCPKLAHAKLREGWRGKMVGKESTTNLPPLIHAIWEWQPVGLQLCLQNIVYNFYYEVHREGDLILFNSSSSLHKPLFWV